MVKNSQYIDLAHDLEIDKAIMFLKQKNFASVRNLTFFAWETNWLDDYFLLALLKEKK